MSAITSTCVRVSTRIRLDTPNVPIEEALSLAVNPMDSTTGPQGLSPILLVFFIVPRMPTRPSDLAKQRQGMEALAKARREMTKIMVKRKISDARRMNVPRAAENDIRTGMDVLFYRERPVNR